MFKPALRSSLRKQLTAASKPSLAKRGIQTGIFEKFNWEDPLGSSSLFTEEEIAISETAESYCQERMLPRVLRMSRTLLYPYPLFILALLIRGY